MTMQAMNQPRGIRYGLIKIRIGSTHMVKGPDGKKRYYVVVDKSRHLSLNAVCVCFECKQTWSTEEELKAAHPEEREMRKNEEKHVYGWWSEEIDAEKPEKTNGKKKSDGPDPDRFIGLLSDVE